MRVIGVYNPPTLITLAGLVSGVMACILSINNQLEFAVIALIWAGIFDLFDGLVARRMSLTAKESEFGIQIDTIVDMVSFGIAPIVVAIGFGLNLLGYIAAIFYIIAAAQRLAYFNVLQIEASGKTDSYTGLPVTFSALIFGIGLSLYYVVDPDIFAGYIAILIFLVGVFYIAPVEIPKPKGMVYILMPVLALAFTGFWTYLAITGQSNV